MEKWKWGGTMSNKQSAFPLLVANQALARTEQITKKIKNGNVFTPATKNAVGNYTIRGIDTIDNVIIVSDQTAGWVRQSNDNGLNWSSNKTRPINVAFDKFKKIIRFKEFLYAQCFNSVTGKWGVYRTLPKPNNVAFEWSTALIEFDNGATDITTAFNCDSDYMYLGEYGDPVGGPVVRRSEDGLNWETIISADATIRHIHAISADPYNPGHIWMTSGDGIAKSIRKSTDFGVTWLTVVASSQYQSVQISFDEKYVYLGGDTQASTLFVINKTTSEIYSGSKNHHKIIAVPGGAVGDLFYANAYFGAVDASTGIYYCLAMDTSVQGNRNGLFYLDSVFGTIHLIDRIDSPNTANTEVFIHGGFVWFGQYKYKAISA